MTAVAAVDLGATSGRVMLGRFSGTSLQLEQVARFPNQPVWLWEGEGARLHWNVVELYRALSDGLAQAMRQEPEIASIGVDSWAVDYALMRAGRMVQAPYHYRDERNGAGVDAVHARVDARSLYGRNGLQHLPFNTLFQLEADAQAGMLDVADRALMIPDLVAYWLSGTEVTERTNASTTGLLDPRTREWDGELMRNLGVPTTLFAPLVDPGDPIGTLTADAARRLGAPSRIQLTAVGSHDTASAFVGVPAEHERVAIISSGTWSLVGIELEQPVLSEAAHAANFTNEGGVDARIRFLKNVSGLWLLSESVRAWEMADGASVDLPALLAEAAALVDVPEGFDVADDRFVAPDEMPDRILGWYRERGVAAPSGRAALVRAILESLADAYVATIAQAEELSGVRVEAIHIVGGGSQNELLCQLTADRAGKPVLAGPVEATAIGNVVVQARAVGLVTGSLESLRVLVRHAFPPRRYEPRAAWV